jgi:hypothetical protein
MTLPVHHLLLQLTPVKLASDPVIWQIFIMQLLLAVQLLFQLVQSTATIT